MDEKLIYCRDPQTGAPWVLDEQPRPIAETKRKRQPINIQRESLDTEAHNSPEDGNSHTDSTTVETKEE